MDNADKLYVGILIDYCENKQRVLCAATIPTVKANSPLFCCKHELPFHDFSLSRFSL